MDLDIGVLLDGERELRCQTTFSRTGMWVLQGQDTRFSMQIRSRSRAMPLSRVLFSPHADFAGPVDRALAELGVYRDVRLIVPSFQR